MDKAEDESSRIVRLTIHTVGGDALSTSVPARVVEKLSAMLESQYRWRPWKRQSPICTFVGNSLPAVVCLRHVTMLSVDELDVTDKD